MTLLEGVNNVLGQAKDFIDDNKKAVVLGSAAVVGSAVVAGVVLSRSSKKRKKITHTKRGRKQDRKRKSKQKWEVAYRKRKRQKRKKKSGRRTGLHYTKKGQPYIILKSGKARFVKGKRRRKK